jgi:hypothetical protein
MLQFQLNKQGDQQFGQNKEYNMVLTLFHDIVQNQRWVEHFFASSS